MPSSKYRLTYFPIKGRAELIRLIFRAARVPFEDRRISFADWNEYKPKTPTGTLPVLEIDGKMFAESGAITNWAARKFGLMGKTDSEQLRTEAIIIQAIDFREKYVGPLFSEKDPEKVEHLREELKTGMNKVLKSWEDSVVQTESTGRKIFSYMITQSMTAADLAVLYVTDLAESYIPVNWAQYPRLQGVIRTVSELQPLKAYLSHRDKADAKNAPPASAPPPKPESPHSKAPSACSNTATSPGMPQTPQDANKPQSSQSKLPATPRSQGTPRSVQGVCPSNKGSAICTAKA